MILRSILLATTALSLGTVLMSTTLNARELEYQIAREPQTCPSRSAPKRGAINVDRAKLYFTCEAESRAFGDFRVFVTDLNLQVAPKPRRATSTDIYLGNRMNTPTAINTDKPVYDIRGSYKVYVCSNSRQSCDLSLKPSSQGICFQDGFNDWHCNMEGDTPKTYKNVPPPQ